MDFTNAIPSANGKPTGGINAFDATEAAPQFAPLPPGSYKARVVRGEYTTTRAGADAYRIRFEVTEGPHAGQTVIRTWTFSERALPYTKRDLAPFGLTSSAKLLSPFPEPGREYLVRLVVALQRGDDGIERNDIKRVTLLSAGPPTDPPAPPTAPPAPTGPTAGPTTAGLPPELARFARGRGKGGADER
jgi:hypothetical protein